jgi:hypothetical protein
MVYGRSSYIAAAMPSSGGIVPSASLTVLEEPSHVPALITTHGTGGEIIDFAQLSVDEDMAIAKLGGFAVDCDYGGGTCRPPAEVTAAQWQFLKDHPFGVAPEPYASGLPASFPSYCKIIN